VRVAPRGDRAQIIDAMRVVGVAVRVQHGVDAVDPGAHELQPELRWRVDQQPAPESVTIAAPTRVR
jgi:hypothetical protein